MTILVHKIPQKPIVTVEGAESGIYDDNRGRDQQDITELLDGMF
jgi:hypothetical protein